MLSLAGLQIVPDKARVAILRALGWKIGENTAICHGVFASASDVSIGSDVYIGPYSYFDSHGGIYIGNSVRIGSHFKILTRSHPIADGSVRAVLGHDIDLRTSIGSGSWIAANVTVLPGASVADRCVIGAGAVVTKPTELGGKYFGVPAKRIL